MTSADTASPSPDTYIVRALAHDLDTGFVRLFETYRHVVFSVVLRICGRWADAEDLTAEAFLRAYRALSTYRGGRLHSLNPKAWLLTIALNLCRNDDRTAGRHRYAPLADQADVLPDIHQNVEEAVTNRETGAELAALLATLPADQRAAIVLRHIADLPIAEIADILGRPENTIKSDIKRGLTRLRATYPSQDRSPAPDHTQRPIDRPRPSRPTTSRPTTPRLSPHPTPPSAAHSSITRTPGRPATKTPGDFTTVAAPSQDHPQPPPPRNAPSPGTSTDFSPAAAPSSDRVQPRPRPSRVRRRTAPVPGTAIRPAAHTSSDPAPARPQPSPQTARPQPPPRPSRVPPHNAVIPAIRPADATPVATAPSDDHPQPPPSRVPRPNIPGAPATAPRPPPAPGASPNNHSSEPRPEPAGGSP